MDTARTDAPAAVSVVVPTYNRPEAARAALDSLRAQGHAAREFIVVDQSERPDPAFGAYAAAHGMHYHRLDRPNRCRAKSFGVRQATGDIVLVCDDDIVAPRDLIATHVRHYRDPNIGAVTCRILEPGQPDTHTRQVLRITPYGRVCSNAHSLRSQFVEFLGGPNMSFRRDLFDRIGYFDERFVGTGIMEEPDIGYRIRQLGYKIYFDASTTVLHYPQANGNRSEMERARIDWYRDYFHNFVLYQRKYGRDWFAVTSAPFHALLAVRQMALHRLGLRDFAAMMAGYLGGFRTPID